ncbi:MAG: segregation/condensation protein A [Spirochaetota bacterium]|nr:segregation/condensation protein A [Spirochaetota bacterium]
MQRVLDKNLNDQDTNKYILHIDNFEGPLDLLWSLIRKAKIDITQIYISQITDQYLDYLRLMKEMDMQIASEFILMASELLYFKSKSLLPGEEIEDEFFTLPIDHELIQKLLEYRKFQLASVNLLENIERQADFFTRDTIHTEIVNEEEFVEVSVIDLMNAFVKLLNTDGEDDNDEIILDEIHVSDIIIHILNLLRVKDQIIFTDIFSNNSHRVEIIASFLAILEMNKMSKIRLMQSVVFGNIWIFRVDNVSYQ